MSTTQLSPFQPDGGVSSTTNGAVTTASTQIILPPIGADGATVIFTNIGTQVAFFAFGNVTASITTSMPLLPNTANALAVPPSVTQVSVISTATGSTLYCTVGRGI